MDFKELTKRLVLGELKNTSVKNEEIAGEAKAEHIDMLLSHTNQGLISLFSKFILYEKEVLIRTYVPETKYFLRYEYARSNTESAATYQYIDDIGDEPFVEDVIKILSVYDNSGEELYIEDIEQHESIFTPQFDCIQIPYVHMGNIFSVIYQARHPVITGVNDEIRIPFFLEEALQVYVASKVLSHMNGQEHSAKGAEYSNLYNSICMGVDNKDMVKASKVTTNTKLEKRGFI